MTIKTERGRVGKIKPLLLLPPRLETMAATQSPLYYRPGAFFLSTPRFLRGPREIYHARGQMRNGCFRQGSRFFTLESPNRDISLADRWTFVNALFCARGAQGASAEGLADLGHGTMGGRSVLTRSFNSQMVIQDIPGNFIGGLRSQVLGKRPRAQLLTVQDATHDLKLMGAGNTLS